MHWMQKLDNGRTGKGILFVISSVSGGGKTTVINRLLENLDGLQLVVSHTTREPRKGECEGKEYFFVSRADFEKIIEKDGFLEWASVYDHYYGTSKQAVDRVLSASIDAILDIDVQGAMQVREKQPDSVLIFIVPPGGEEQERRLRGRGTETNEELLRRLEAAGEELALVREYDYAVLNDEIESTVNTVKSIIVSQRCRPGKDRDGNSMEGETIV
jgi:guanylate kinase